MLYWRKNGVALPNELNYYKLMQEMEDFLGRDTSRDTNFNKKKALNN